MSNESKTTIYTVIVAAIMSLLNLDDAGRLQKFFNREIRDFKREIVKIKQNIETKVVGLTMLKAEYADKLEDATEAVTSAYHDVDMDKLASNASMDAFSPIYWKGVEDAEAALKLLQDKLEKAVEKAEEAMKVEKDKLAKFEGRVKILSAKPKAKKA